MKRLGYLLIWAFHCTASAQSFPVKNVNDEYFVSSIYNADIVKNNFHDFVRDKNGLYWFQNLTEVYSFDGNSWRSYKFKSMNRRSTPFRINDIETTEDGNIWLGTEDGIYIFDRESECFITVKQKFPEIKDLPLYITCFFLGQPGTLIFLSFQNEGFYLLDWKLKRVQHVIIDKDTKAYVPTNGYPVTTDRSGNIWGTTTDYRGVWQYNQSSKKMCCSWKGELPQFADKRFQSSSSYTYSPTENAIWISHSTRGYVEKMDVRTGKSIFYSFSDNLKVRADSNAVNKYEVFPVKIDRNNDKWVNAGSKYIIKLSNDLTRMEYLCHDVNSLPIGEFQLFKPETAMNNSGVKDNSILLWIQGVEKISMIKKRGTVIRHVYFDSLSRAGIRPKDYLNTDRRQSIFFEKGKNDQYFLLQKNQGRPKLICFDRDLRIKKVLFNDQWKQYPAFFSKFFNLDTLYIALLRPDVEPLDFRTVVLKDFRIDLNTLTPVEVKLDFKERVWRYGQPDATNVYWLFSNGYLYSYNPQERILDSMFVCEPYSKGMRTISLVKGYDYPTTLHKNTSTFWIDFFTSKQLYKIDLRKKKIDKIFKCCLDDVNCEIPGGIYNLYEFDSLFIYLKSSLSSMLLNARTDSLILYPDLFQRNIPAQVPVGSGRYRDWVYLVCNGHIYFLNTTNRNQKELMIDEDFKWRLGEINSAPLVNDRGDFILMSGEHGFLVFNIDSTPVRIKPGTVNYSLVKINNNELPVASLLNNTGLRLKYNSYSDIQIAFSDYSIFSPEKTRYEYALYKGEDTTWNSIDGKPQLTLSDLSPGKYQLLVRAANVFGDYSEEIKPFPITIVPLWWQTWWFKILVVVAIGGLFYCAYYYRMRQLLHLQTIRNNIASDLHDDIGSTLNSISIYSEVAKQQAGKEIPALDLIGMNSRKIVESMSDIVWTINPENDSFEKIIVRMRSFAYQLLKAKQVDYSFEVDEKLYPISLPMQVRKNFYLVFKEAITNLVKYSQASRVHISLYEENKTIILKIRDNGKGIPENPETQGNGLLNMKHRAEEIHASLLICSGNDGGTSIELVLKT